MVASWLLAQNALHLFRIVLKTFLKGLYFFVSGFDKEFWNVFSDERSELLKVDKAIFVVVKLVEGTAQLKVEITCASYWVWWNKVL